MSMMSNMMIIVMSKIGMTMAIGHVDVTEGILMTMFTSMMRTMMVMLMGNKRIVNIYSGKHICHNESHPKKSRIRETSNLSTDADCRTDTILESLRNLSREKREKKWGG